MNEAIIVGAGVIGLSTAYHLARKQFGKVTIFDKGPLGDGSGSRAAGIITGLLWTETGVLTRKKSLELFHELTRELDGYRFHNSGTLNLFDAESWEQRRALLPLYKRLDAPFEIIDVDEIHYCWAGLSPREDWVGLFDPAGGYSEPDEYIPALARKCKSLGVVIRENCKVEGFVKENRCVTGIRTPDGALRADVVICTVYGWTLQLLQSVGERLPVKCFVHQRYVTAPLDAPVDIPAVNANPLGGYVRPAAGTRLLCGIETIDRQEFHVPSTDFHLSSLTVDPDLKTQLQRNFSTMVPALEQSVWEDERIGLLTFSSDLDPILGPVEKLLGLYVAVCLHSGGFAYNPVAGMMLAEYVADGRTSIDVSSFSPNRFRSEDVDEYLETTFAQKDVDRYRH